MAPDTSDTTGRTIYIGTVFGGVWKSIDKGASWVPLTDFQPSLAITALVVDHQRIFAATGDRLDSSFNSGTRETNGAESYFGAGILFSANGGSSWTTIGAAEFTGKIIMDIAFSGDGSTLYVAGTGLWAARQAGDGSWGFTQLSAGNWSSVRVNPGNADVVNLGKWSSNDGGPYFYTLSTGTIMRATLNGTPQMPISSTNAGRTALAIDPKVPNYVYSSMQCLASCPQLPDGTANWWGVYYSTDYGRTFNPFISPGQVPSAQLYEFSNPAWTVSIAVDPVDDYYVYFGLVNLWSFSYHTNAISNLSSPGSSPEPPDCNWWANRYGQTHGGIHCDQNSITFDSAGTLYSGNDGGIFASPYSTAADGPRNQWIDLNSNLNITQFYQGVSYNAANPNRLLAGTQDNGTQAWNGTSWQVTGAGDGGFTAIDPTDPGNTWFYSWVTLCISRTNNGSIPWSANSAPTWSPISGGFTLDPSGLNPTCSVLGAEFIAPFTMDPTNHAYVLAGADRPYLTKNANALNPSDVRWQDIRGTTFFLGARSITATTICADPANHGIFYLGTNDGYAVTTTNGYSSPPTWLLDSTNLPGQWVTRIVCGSASTMYLTVGGSQTVQGTHVFKQTQGGASWTSIQGDLPNTTVTSLIEDPRARPSTLYVSTDLGVYRSTNGGANWLLLGHSLPNVPVVDLVFDPGRYLMYAFTHGRGVWRLATGIPESVPGLVAPGGGANLNRTVPPPVPREPVGVTAQALQASQQLMREIADFLFGSDSTRNRTPSRQSPR